LLVLLIFADHHDNLSPRTPVKQAEKIPLHQSMQFCVLRTPYYSCYSWQYREWKHWL
jgi:hypothetical protein